MIAVIYETTLHPVKLKYLINKIIISKTIRYISYTATGVATVHGIYMHYENYSTPK